ncbi:biotin transporter BioY [Agromyces sp. NPDC056379]|uniref:biotin transporter BioY n=1 Tax=unclassified Agromyces TaxID=2639701 RepID=UPI0035D9FE7F
MSSAHSTSPSTSPSTTESNATPPSARQRRSSARDLAQIAVFAALIAALGLPGALSIGGTAVPITFQTLGVMLAGAILGARKGTLSVLLFIVLVAAGLPLLSGGRGGLGVFVGPSVGYLIGWLLGAAVIGWATARLLPRYPIAPALAWTALGGIVAIYLVGVPVFAAITGTPFGGALLASTFFLPGDILKVVVTVLVAKSVHRAWPGLIEPRSWPWASRPGTVAAAPAADPASDSTASDRSA